MVDYLSRQRTGTPVKQLLKALEKGIKGYKMKINMGKNTKIMKVENKQDMEVRIRDRKT